MTYLNIHEVCDRFGITKKTVYLWMENNGFPKQIKLGPRLVRWRLDELEEFEQRCRSSQEVELVAKK